MRSWNQNPSSCVILTDQYIIYPFYFIEVHLKMMNLNNLAMESVALPKELIWDGKSEPLTPTSALLTIFEPAQSWLLFGNNFANEFPTNSDQLFEIKPGFDIINEFIFADDQIVGLSNLKEENWIDPKLVPPIQHINNTQNDIIPISASKDQSLIKNNCYGATALQSTSLTQLTPPQSPVNTSSVTDGRQQLHTISPTHASSPKNSFSEHFDESPWSGSGITKEVTTFFDEIERETQIVDEIVNTRAKELNDWNDDSESMSSLSHPSMQSVSEDDFLAFSSSTLSSSSISSPVHTDEGDSFQTQQITSIGKRHSRLYGRGVEDRKIRKKEQNKNAATRYRQKKKQEMEIVLGEEQQLINRNDELKKILTDRKREEKYLKALIREFYKKKS